MGQAYLRLSKKSAIGPPIRGETTRGSIRRKRSAAIGRLSIPSSGLSPRRIRVRREMVAAMEKKALRGGQEAKDMV